MKRTLEDIKRHSAIMTGIIDAIDGKLEGLEDDERSHLMRELTITGLATIGIRNPQDFGKAVTEATNRALEIEKKNGKTRLN